MNGVFFKLKAEFEPDVKYIGKEVIKEILQTIRVIVCCLCNVNSITGMACTLMYTVTDSKMLHLLNPLVRIRRKTREIAHKSIQRDRL